MSWTNLFKKSRLRPDPRLRWFGKLPTYPDYYSSAADEDWAVEFNDFVLKGFEIYQRPSAQRGAALPRLPESGCILRLPKSEMAVFATLLDFGGDMRGRPFPICFYAGMPTALLPGPTSERLTAPMRIIRDLLALRREVAHFLNSPGRMESVFGEREIDFSGIGESEQASSWATGGGSLTMTDWFAAANSGLKVRDQADWLNLVHRWGENLAKLDGKGFEPTLRFPLAMKLPLDIQAGGWMSWLESRIDLRRRVFSFIISGDFNGHFGAMTLVARSLVPEDFLLLTPSAGTLPYLDDLSSMETAGEDAGRAETGPGEADKVAATPGLWVDFAKEGRR